jgi:cyclopropane fatty-acyl-phospholipid synthase-like methyltransferase
MSQNLPGRERFEEAYEGNAPWDIGKPQPVFMEAADQITGTILDIGCGTGENALFFAQRGHQVTGIDFLAKPIGLAKQKAQQRGLQANFLVMDALALSEIPQLYDSAIDCGLFHVFSDDDRSRYVHGLATILKPSGKFYMLCFSDKEPPGQGPRRVSQQELYGAWSRFKMLASKSDPMLHT